MSFEDSLEKMNKKLKDHLKDLDDLSVKKKEDVDEVLEKGRELLKDLNDEMDNLDKEMEKLRKKVIHEPYDRAMKDL